MSAGARLQAALAGLHGMCAHPDVEPVILVTGETVAQVCVHCLRSLPAQWGCTDCEWVEDRVLSSPVAQYSLTALCDQHSRV